MIVPVDVHRRAFKVDYVTAAAHVEPTLWRVEHQLDDSPVFEIAVPRSLATSSWQALSDSAAEFGFDVAQFELSAARGNGYHVRESLADAAAELGAFGT